MDADVALPSIGLRWERRLDDTLPYLHDVHGIVCGPPTDARRGIMWKTCTRVWWAWLNSLIVIARYCHSWYLRDFRVSCCQVDSLVRL
jgi:hypothetical protein